MNFPVNILQLSSQNKPFRTPENKFPFSTPENCQSLAFTSLKASFLKRSLASITIAFGIGFALFSILHAPEENSVSNIAVSDYAFINKCAV